MNQISISNPYFSSEGFAQIGHHLQLLLTPDEHYLLHVFMRYMNLNNGNCFPTKESIKTQTGWGNDRFYKNLNQLIEKHVVKKRRVITNKGWHNDYEIYQFGNIDTCKQVVEMLDNDESLKAINTHTYNELVQFINKNSANAEHLKRGGCPEGRTRGLSRRQDTNNINNNNNIKTPYNPPKATDVDSTYVGSTPLQINNKKNKDNNPCSPLKNQKQQLDKPTNKKAPCDPPKGDARAPDSEKPKSEAEGHQGKQSQQKPKQTDTPQLNYDDFKRIWNSEFEHDAVPKIRTLTAKRKKKLAQRAQEFQEQTGYELTLERWQQLLKHLKKSRFLMGCAQTNQTWIMNFDFIVRSEHVLTRILEGTYHEPESTQS